MKDFIYGATIASILFVIIILITYKPVSIKNLWKQIKKIDRILYLIFLVIVTTGDITASIIKIIFNIPMALFITTRTIIKLIRKKINKKIAKNMMKNIYRVAVLENIKI